MRTTRGGAEGAVASQASINWRQEPTSVDTQGTPAA